MTLKLKSLLGIFAFVGCVLANVFSANANQLHDAVKTGKVESVKKCLALNPSWISEKDCVELNGTPLFYARNFETVKCLIDGGSDVKVRNMFESTPVHHLVDLCDMRVVELLVQKGADINARNCYSETPLAHLDRTIRTILAFYTGEPLPEGVVQADRFYGVKGEVYLSELRSFREKLVSIGATL